MIDVMHQVTKMVFMTFTLLLPLVGSVSTASAADLLKSSPASKLSIQRYGEQDKLCLAWTDGCVNCNREGCSNIGIACQPKKIACTQREKNPEK